MTCEPYAVSVVIPAYNNDASLAGAVASALGQSVAPAEVIVVDDGSTDGTADVARSFTDRVRLIQQNNAGSAIARNTGIAAATARWVAFLDADDAWRCDHLERCGSVLDGDPTLAWCCGAYMRQLRDGRQRPGGSPTWHRRGAARCGAVGFFDAWLAGAPIQTSGMVVRRDVFDAVGMFDPDMRRGQDRDMWYRIALAHPRMGFSWPPTVRYAYNEHSVTARRGDATAHMLPWLSKTAARLAGVDASTRIAFEPVVRQLAGEILWHSLNVARPDCLRWLLAEHRDLLSTSQRAIAWCGARTPAPMLRGLSRIRGRTMTRRDN
ncbi:MAG: glycosyltransferase family 2 protein [Phycisphaerae bacterium]